VKFLCGPVEIGTDDFPVGLDGGFGAVVLAKLFKEVDDVSLSDLINGRVIEEFCKDGKCCKIVFGCDGRVGRGDEVKFEAWQGMNERKHRDVVSFC